MTLESIFPLLINQLIQVSCVALVAMLLTKCLNGTRPHLVHAAWLLVMLKCITPPVVASPTSPFSWVQTAWGRTERSSVVLPQKDSYSRAGHRASYEAIMKPDVVTTSSSKVRKHAAGRWHSRFVESCQTMWTSIRSLNHIQLALLAWLAMSGVIFSLILLRLLSFLRMVQKTKIKDESNEKYLQRLDHQLRRVEVKLGMRHRAQVTVVDALIGPAILGVIRPMILLPKIVVDSSSDKQLETLIAHELVHFRRGDLWWSALQAIAVSCYWFNPLIWLARTIMNRESEKCCDEETIGSLRCEPGEYARCLISVLECKHSLRAAPLLPGVRPVDITAKRLERIMKLRHGCHRQCPRWVLATLLLGASVALPGASLSFAQQDSSSEPKPLQSKPLPLPPRDIGQLKLNREDYRVESFDVTNVLNKLAGDGKLSPPEAASLLLSRLPAPTPNTVQAQVAVPEPSRVPEPYLVLKLGRDQPNIQIHGNRLYMFGTEHDCNTVSSYLRHFRYFGNQVLAYEIRILDVSTDRLNALNIDWKQKEGASPPEKTEGANVIPASYESIDIQPDCKVTKIEQAKIDELLSSDRCVTISAPKIVTINEQSAEVSVGSRRPFVVKKTAVEGSVDQPEIRTMDEGFKFELKSRVISDDASSLELDFHFTQTAIKGVGSSSVESNGSELTIEQPVVTKSSLRNTADLQLGSTIAITGAPELTSVTFESGLPILSKVPYVNRLFKQTVTGTQYRSKVLLVRCTLVDAEVGPTNSTDRDDLP